MPEPAFPDLSIVVPVHNEAAAIAPFLAALRPVLAGVRDETGLSHEILFVDDGSRDGTAARVAAEAAQDGAIRLLSFSRNFGKEAALTAGLDFAGGRAVIPIDVDLQDPPELIRDFVRLWQAGHDVVYAERVSREADTALKRVTAGLFYRVFNRLSDTPIAPNVGDYRLMSRAAVEATRSLRERNRFMKGLFAWAGFPAVAVPYERPARAAGRTKFNYWRLWNLALDGITSFSTIPLRVWTYVGLAVAAGALGYMVTILVRTWVFGRDVPGYASIMVVMLLLGAVQLVSLGVIGEYLSRLYIEAKQRPLYHVHRTLGFGRAAGADPQPAPAQPVPAMTEAEADRRLAEAMARKAG